MLKEISNQVTTLNPTTKYQTNFIQTLSSLTVKSDFTLPQTIWKPTKSLETSSKIKKHQKIK